MPRRFALPLLCALLVLAPAGTAALVGSATGSPQPTPVCNFCGTQFEEAASSTNTSVIVAESTAVVQVHDDGTATWTVRNRLADGADAFRDEPDTLDRTARALEGRRGLPRQVTAVSARVEGDVVVITATQPDAATSHAGLLVVEFLHDRGGEPWYVVNADRFEVRAPEGQVVTNTPPAAEVSGASAIWTGNVDEEYYDAPDLEGSPYVVFGPDRGGLTGVRTAAAIGLATLPIALGAIRLFVMLQTLAFGVVLAGVTLGVRSARPTIRLEWLGGALITLGVIGTVAPAVAQGPGWVVGPPLFALGFGALVSHRQWRTHLRSPAQQALGGVGILLAVMVALAGWYTLMGVGSNPLARAVHLTVPALPFAALIPLGGALTSRRAIAWGVVAVGAFVAVPLAIIDLGNPPVGLAAGIMTTVMFALAVLTPVVGVLAVIVGLSLAHPPGGADDGSRQPDRDTSPPERLRSP